MTTNNTGHEHGESFRDSRRGPTQLATGGFTPDTEVLTSAGPVRVDELEQGTRVYTFDPMTKLATLNPVTAVSEVPFDDDLVALETKRCDFRVHPDHRMLCQGAYANNIQVRQARRLDDRETNKFVNSWETPPGERLPEVDITDMVKDYEMCAETDVHGHTVRAQLPAGCEPVRRNSHIGYVFDPETFKSYQSEIESIAVEVTIHAGPNHHRRPYRFDGDDFIEFLGWFVTEGSTYWSKSSDTVQVSIAQDNPTHRAEIKSLLKRMGLLQSVNAKAFQFASKVFGRLFESLCGTKSRDKHLPPFVWTLPTEQQQRLLDTLMAGDGNDKGVYYTASDRLAAQMCRLFLECGLKPRWSQRSSAWRVAGYDNNEGYLASRNVHRVEWSGTLHRLTVANHPAILAGRNGRFQWIGVSGVA